ncbi:nucleotide-binding universal stress UspA family protein [Curtobacterium sp. PhB130]|uniref:universal stress protein n=1 Tax=unclassified Curtobacterium TaxID=257496 RepID=UPI000F4BFEB1|nr:MULTISPECIES: universal stress protein [unclassified Curtobacterium]ROP64802.1 nucleotide-binding universal stress UspA family protein [Curtobacterium sp. ZW137]ROS75094.1 nucleotide-binding universal stress UspA family protein [Curtobacterium sp. PhB130]TCK63722.1 nucleotide-binding universal stress UspA family protein [Curtobacterium sp. PhB136]
MDTDRFGKIVVGFDGSEESTAALLAALTLADGLDAQVDVVTSWRWPVTWSSLPVGSSWSPLHDAEEIRQQATELLENTGPHRAEVMTREAEGSAADVLLSAAVGAALLVVGSRGRGGFRGLLLGSVSTACMQHAPCPVLIHRGVEHPEATGVPTIVVGVDGSHESGQALRFAVTTARRLGHRVRVITTWQWPKALNRDEAPFDHWSPERDARATASSALDAAEDLIDDDVEVTSDLVEGSPAEVLIDASRDAALLVLGNRGLGGFRGLLVGSVSQECAQHAHCPVVVHRS